MGWVKCASRDTNTLSDEGTLEVGKRREVIMLNTLPHHLQHSLEQPLSHGRYKEPKDNKVCGWVLAPDLLGDKQPSHKKLSRRVLLGCMCAITSGSHLPLEKGLLQPSH